MMVAKKNVTKGLLICISKQPFIAGLFGSLLSMSAVRFGMVMCCLSALLASPFAWSAETTPSHNAPTESAFAEAKTQQHSQHIQILAASCAACHGPDGNSVNGTPVLAGLERNYFILQLQAFRSGERSATVMHQHAKGLSQEEIESLADYFAHSQRRTPEIPQHQPWQATP